MEQNLGSNIEKARRDRGISLVQLASAAGIDRSTLYRMLNGATRSPRLSTLRRLARALGVALAELTGQVELPFDTAPNGEVMRALISRQLSLVPLQLRGPAAFSALGAILDVAMSAGARPRERDLRRFWPRTGSPQKMSNPRLERDLLKHFDGLPLQLKRIAAHNAILAMVDIELRAGMDPSGDLYAILGCRPLRREATPRRQGKDHTRRQRRKRQARGSP